MLRSDETWHRLQQWTAGQAPSERLAAQVLAAEGYADIDPIHPLGGPDGGKDALAKKDGRNWIMAAYFPRGQQRLTTITDKFISDFAGVEANGADGMAFVTNQELTDGERKGLRDAVPDAVDIFHLERLVGILDRPAMAQVREQYLGIPAVRRAALAPQERLAELERLSIGRCVSRWQAAGLSREEAEKLAADRTVGQAGPGLLPAPGEVCIWTAPMGSGKSIAAERFHQDSIETAKGDDEAPIPVFLKATVCLPNLAETIESDTQEVGDPRRRGADVVVDGLDELGSEGAEILLSQARAQVRVWPQTKILLVSRSLPTLSGVEEEREFLLLSDRQAAELVEMAAGGEAAGRRLASLPNTLHRLIRQPLFAIATGVWMRENDGVPRAPIDLFAELGRQAAAKVAVEQANLREMAALAIRHNLGEIPAAEIPDPDQASRLAGTGLVAKRAIGYEFTLPALAQWFSAQALLEKEISVEEILGRPDEIELWRYPLALAVSSAATELGNEILRLLFDTTPGFAFSVLELLSNNAVLGGIEPPAWEEGGLEVRQAMQAIADAFATGAGFVADVNPEGRVVPLGVASDEHHLTVASYLGSEERPDVFPLPPDFNPFDLSQEWGQVRGAIRGPGAAWAWIWVRDAARGRLEGVIKRRHIPIDPDGPLAEEQAWDFATTVMRTSILGTDQLPLDEVIERAMAIPGTGEPAQRVIYQHAGGHSHDLRAVLGYLLRRRKEGVEILQTPLPPADRLDGGSWIGELYSDERLLEVADQMYRRAMTAYRELVERWFPRFASRLEHYVLLPARIEGNLRNTRKTESGFGPIPHISGYLLPLPEGSADEVAIGMGELDQPFERASEVWRAQKVARPNAARWLGGTVGGLPFEVGHRTPVAEIVYRWLGQDFHRLGMASSLAGRSHDRSTARWSDE